MYEFLQALTDEELKRLAEAIAGRPVRTNARERLVKVIFACKGYDLLSEKLARQRLLESVALSELLELRRACSGKVPEFVKPYDGAIALAQVPWRSGSAFVWAFAQLFGVTPRYLPRRGGRVAAIESIEPTSELPPLLDFQIEVLDELKVQMAAPSGASMLVQMPTGAGKTRTVMEAVGYWLRLDKGLAGVEGVLWMAHTQELCEQAIETFERMWLRHGDREISLVRMWGDYRPTQAECSGAFVVGGFAKLGQLAAKSPDWQEWLQRSVGLVVVDEAHKAVADTVASVVAEIQKNDNAKVIGLTATPGRSIDAGRENRELVRLFGGRLVRPRTLGDDPIAELQRRGVLAAIKREPLRTDIALVGNVESSGESDDDVPYRVLRDLAQNESRNQLIVDRASSYISNGHKVLVYACTVDHAKDLALGLAAQGHNAGYIDCTMRPGARSSLVGALRAGKLDALTNFGVLSTGFDAPNISVVMITRPTTSIVLYSQMLGRGLRGRKMGGTDACIVVDVRDNVDQFGELGSVYTHFDEFWTKPK